MWTNQAVERSKAGNGQVVRGVSPIGKEKAYGGKDLPKSQVLSSEWTYLLTVLGTPHVIFHVGRHWFQQTTLQLTIPARQLHCFQLRHPSSSVHSTDHQTARTSIRLIMRSGAFCKSESTVVGSVTSINLIEQLIEEWRHFDQSIIDRAVK